MILTREEVSLCCLTFSFRVYLKRVSFDHTRQFQMAWSTALAGVTIGYINLIFGERYQNIITKDRLGELKNIYILMYPLPVG